jgi:hypothetical protein
MNYLDTLLMLLRWSKDGWEVHPIDLSTDFNGWV